MRLTPVLLTVALSAAVLTGCDQVEEAANNAAGDAACSVAGSAIDEAGQAADRIAGEIDANPEAAQRELQALGGVLRTAAGQVDGALGGALTEARDAVEDLAGQAREAASGVDVDTSAVDDARARLDEAVAEARNVC